MQRIPQVTDTTASPEAAALLSQVKEQMGSVPNILKTMAQSHAVLGGYLGFAGALGGGKLSPQFREQIALATAGKNECDYCASVHTAVGGGIGLSATELSDNLRGKSSEAKVTAALNFVAQVIDTRGNVSAEDLREVRNAGFSEEEIVEIIAHTALNIFTNYFNHVAETEIDFPRVDARLSVAA